MYIMNMAPRRIKVLIHDNQTITRNFEAFSFHHILREVNFLVDVLANIGHTVSN